jgi:hypothetical protein
MFEPVCRWPKEATYSAFEGMENENDEDDSHFDRHSSASSSRMGPMEDADIDFLQLRVDDSLLGPERVQVFQVSMKELELGKSNLCVDSSQLARSSTSKEPRQFEIFRRSEDSQLIDDTLSIHSVSTISGMPSLFDPVDENIYVSATRPSTLGANVASSATIIGKDEKASRFYVLPCCFWNGDKSPSRSGEMRPRRAAWFEELPLVAKIGVIVFVLLFVVSIVTIIVSVVDNDDEPDPSSTGSVDTSATSPTDLYTATPVASLTGSPTSSPVSIPTPSPTTSNNLVSTSTPVAQLTDSPTSSPLSIPTPLPTTTKKLSTATPVASLTDSPTSSPVSIPTAPPTPTNTNAATDVPIAGVVCVDDTVATFAVNRVTRDCAWLSESPASQVLLCRPGQGAFEVCRETCNNCPT